MIYDIPSFECLDAATTLTGPPVWKHPFETDNDTCPPLIQVIHPTREAHAEGLVIIFTWNVFMTLTPSPDHSGGYHFRVFKHPEVPESIDAFDTVHLTPRRFFHLSMDYMTFTTCTLALSDANNGSLRLGQPASTSGCIDRMHTILLDETTTSTSPISATMPLLNRPRSLECMSWDEESGQLCLLVAADRRTRNEFVVINFV
jgi:hypothetical protein